MSEKETAKAELVLNIGYVGLPAPKCEFIFHPTRKWRFDLAWPEHKIALEVDGAVYANGRHTRGQGYEEDCIKFAEAQLLGWTVYRFSTGQVMDGIALNYLQAALVEKGVKLE